MDTNLQPKRNIKDFMAFPKSWQDDGKWNAPYQHKNYPYQPQILNVKGKLEPIGGMLNPLTFKSAREEEAYYKENPEMAQKIAEARATLKGPSDQLEASNASMRKLVEANKEVVAERNALEGEVTDLKDQLAAARAELDAAMARRRGASSPVQDEEAAEEAAPTGKKRGRKSRAEILAAQQG